MFLFTKQTYKTTVFSRPYFRF